VIAPLIEMLHGAGYELLQLPCPETAFTGVSRWWFVYEQYDSVNYRRHCARIARAVSKLVKPYSENGYDIVLLGLGISPSCGVRMRQTNKQWRGRPFDVSDGLRSKPVAACGSRSWRGPSREKALDTGSWTCLPC